MLKVKNISSGYGKKQVLYDVSLKMEQGEVVLITGGNGSGKSTLLKCIYNIIPLWSGQITFNDERIDRLKPAGLIKRGIVYIPQKDYYFENLTIEENLQISGSIYSLKQRTKRVDRVYQLLPDLKFKSKLNAVNLSGGEKKILSIGIGIIHEPKLILIDEPFTGLDFNKKKDINILINNLNSIMKIGLIIVEHKLNSMNFTNIYKL